MRPVLLYCLLFLVIKAQSQSLPPVYKLDGKEAVINAGSYKAVVFVMLSPECPLCQGYSLTLRNLYKEYKSKQIQFIGIVPGTYFTKKMIEEYMNTYQIPFPVYRDKDLKMVKYFSATITPEVFIISGTHKILYSGRIDNWAYAPGKKRSTVTEYDLANALKEISEGKTVQKAKTKAIGCFIEE